VRSRLSDTDAPGPISENIGPIEQHVMAAAALHRDYFRFPPMRP